MHPAEELPCVLIGWMSVVPIICFFSCLESPGTPQTLEFLLLTDILLMLACFMQGKIHQILQNHILKITQICSLDLYSIYVYIFKILKNCINLYVNNPCVIMIIVY